MSKRKGPSEDNPNREFCELLIELADYEKNVSRNVHKYNAYRRAAAVIAAEPNRLRSRDEAKKLPGVGDKIADKLDEFLQTGKLKKLDEIHKDDDSTAIGELTRVSGVGPANAKRLVDLGIRTIEDLKRNESELTHHQLVGLRYLEDFEKLIPRSEISRIETMIKREISKLDPLYKITVCGSYRRGNSTGGDVDILLTYPETQKTKEKPYLKQVVSALESSKIIIDTLSLGENKFMGVCKASNELPARRLDIRYIPHDQYYCAILFFTGSAVFNKVMRGHALEKGFTLNEYCLRPIGSTGVPGKPLEIKSEQDIFDYIDYPYKKPEDRNA